MEKLKNVWVVSETPAAISELTAGARLIGESVTLVYAGDRNFAVNAEKAYYLGPVGAEVSFVSYIPAVAALVAENRPDAVLLSSSQNGRLAASHIAAVCGCSVQADAQGIEVSGGDVRTKRMVYGGSALKVELGGPVAVVCVGAGVMQAGNDIPVKNIEDLACKVDDRLRFIEKRPKVAAGVDLTAAKRVVGVGRGLSDEDDLKDCRRLAGLIGAEVGCSRPVSEEKHWLPRENYIGVSGAMLKPECYFAIGISGQIQHMVGVNSAGTIIAINKSDTAPIFKTCDYGIVGDIKKIVPALIKLLTK